MIFVEKKKIPKIVGNWTMRRWLLTTGVRLSNDFAIDVMPNLHLSIDKQTIDAWLSSY